MPSTSSNSLSIADFENFSQRTSTSESAIIGKKLFGSGAKKISSLNFQLGSGGTSSVIEDFRNALIGKYGEEIADFVFSSENEKAALSQGLNKKTIQAVLNKAEAVKKSHFFSYQKAIDNTQKLVEKKICQLPESSRANISGEFFKIKKDWAACCANAFSWENSGTPKMSPEDLTIYFQEKREVIDKLAKEIVIEDVTRIFQSDLKMPLEQAREAIASLRATLGDRLALGLLEDMSEQHFSIHQLDAIVKEILITAKEGRASLFVPPSNITTTITTSEEKEELSSHRSSIISEQGEKDPYFIHEVDDSAALKALLEKHPQLQQVLNNLTATPEILKTKTDLLNKQLQPFVDLLANTAPENYFYLPNDNSKTVALYSPSDRNLPSPTQEQKESAAQQFFSALKEFYGAALIDAIVPADQQKQLLTVQQAREVFTKLHETHQKTAEFLKKTPIIITPEYLAALACNPQEALVIRNSHEQLGKEAQTLINTLREMGICGMIFSGTKIGLAIAGVCTTTPACIVLALTAAAADGYMIGRLVTREEGLSSGMQHEAGTITAISTTGSATGLILSRILQPLISAYVPEVVTATIGTIGEYGGSALALALRNATNGGARIAQQQEHSNVDDMNHKPEEDVFLETRVARWFGLQSYIDALTTSIGNFVGLTNTSSTTATSSSSTNNSNT